MYGDLVNLRTGAVDRRAATKISAEMEKYFSILRWILASRRVIISGITIYRNGPKRTKPDRNGPKRTYENTEMDFEEYLKGLK